MAPALISEPITSQEVTAARQLSRELQQLVRRMERIDRDVCLPQSSQVLTSMRIALADLHHLTDQMDIGAEVPA